MPPSPNDAVFHYDGDLIVPTELARGPWMASTQHGGAPAGLLAHLAGAAIDEPGWELARITIEFLRPVPLSPLSTKVEVGKGRSVRRVALVLNQEGVPVARAAALLVRAGNLDFPQAATLPGLPLPLPGDCAEPVKIPGMPEVTSFHYTATESYLAAGSVTEPGPAAAWFRLAVPLLGGIQASPISRIVSAADFGNGISWTLPLDRFTFANVDLTVYVHRPARSAWVAADSNTMVAASGIGLTHTCLYDEHGLVGVAHQTLVIRPREHSDM